LELGLWWCVYLKLAIQNSCAFLCRRRVCIFRTPSRIEAPKEELWKLKYFTMKKYDLQKNPLKNTKILQDIL
jgi:hypothetical protein